MTKQLVEDYAAAWNGDDVDYLMSFFHDDVIYEDVALSKVVDKAGLKAFYLGMKASFKHIRFEIVSLCFGENFVSWEWRMIGERNDGTTIDTPGQSLTELKDGLVIANRDYWSTLPAPAVQH